MAGVKGRSGRKSWDKERDLHRLWDLAVPIIVGALNSAKVPDAEKRQIALKLLEKMTPQAQVGSTAPVGPAPKFIFLLGNGERKEVSTAEMLHGR